MKYPEDFINKIICGNCLELMKIIPDNSIDLIVTSPPYNADKKYSGYNDNLSWDNYHHWLCDICLQFSRIIKPNSNVFINICDIGISNEDAAGEHKIGNRGNFYVIPNHSVTIEEMVGLGMQYLNPIIWRKPSNCNSQFGANARFCGTYPYPKNCHVPSEIEFILHFRKNGVCEKIDKERKEKSRIAKERWMEISGQIWEFNGARNKDHPAKFPIELPSRCIEGWSFVDDIVLDPFMGSGTTALACKKLKRNYIGMDISKEYCEIAEEKVERKFYE